MRIWLLGLASCWTGPVAPAPVAAPTRMVVARPPLTPTGFFVPDLIAHRLETQAFDEVDGLGGELAAFDPNALEQRPRPIPRTHMIGHVTTPSPAPINTPPAGDAHLVVEYCIDATGRVASAHISQQTVELPGLRFPGVPSDRDVLTRLHRWRFAPYFVAGKPVMACSYVDYSLIASTRY